MKILCVKLVYLQMLELKSRWKLCAILEKTATAMCAGTSRSPCMGCQTFMAFPISVYKVYISLVVISTELGCKQI